MAAVCIVIGDPALFLRFSPIEIITGHIIWICSSKNTFNAMVSTKHCICIVAFVIAFVTGFSQKNKFVVFGYYAGRASMVDSFPVEKLTHLCFSFTHLKGSAISLGNCARQCVAGELCGIEEKKPIELKIIVSMGGWTGCYSCSEVFSTDSSRKIFASSTKKLLNDFNADGIDLDWEYPTIKGAPGHPYSLSDKDNFTALIQTLRDTLGKQKELSFAAGGFTSYINESIDWKKVTPLVDRINIMTYDLITGYDTITGHHTGLYSTSKQKESCDNAVKMLIAKGVPAKKLLIGAAFYARIWENVSAENDGLYGKGKFLRGVSFNSYAKSFTADPDFVYHWDKEASAPYLYNAKKKWFVTFDDSASIAIKTQYAIKQKLNGFMFWQLADDNYSAGLLDIVDEVRRKKK
jgi:chitinase